jgi:hypothetical protein
MPLFLFFKKKVKKLIKKTACQNVMQIKTNIAKNLWYKVELFFEII